MDFFLTIDQQVNFIWNRKFSIPSIILILMHLTTACFNMTNIALQYVTTCLVSLDTCCVTLTNSRDRKTRGESYNKPMNIQSLKSHAGN